MQVYTVEHPDDEVESPEVSGGMDVEETDILGARGTAETISSPANELDPDFHFKGGYAKRRALELEELLNTPATTPLPISFDAEPSINGYYSITSTRRTLQLLTQDGDTHETIATSATQVGTRSSHRRAIRCLLSRPDPGNTFGAALTALVGVPADATNVRWYDREFQTSASATVSSTVQARFGDVDLCDARDVNNTLGDDPVLVYQPASYDVIGDVDVGVWDTYGSDTPRDNDDVVQWGRVFSTEHDPRVDDELVIENGLVRLWVQDGTEQNIQADEWDPSTSSWSPVSLPTSEWTLVETDLTRIGSAAVEAQCTFDDGSTTYALDMRLERGRQYPQWLVPESVTNDPPSGLQTLLDPIADDSDIVTEAELGLVARRKLRQ